MLYDKNHFKKINDKKVLHKVRKHWVVLSLATLMLLGGGSVVSNTTAHASQNGNHSSNNGSNNNSLKNTQGDNHSPQLVSGNQFANQPTQPNDTDSSNQNASNSGGDLNALNLSRAKPQANDQTSNLLNSHSRLANQMGQGRTKQSQPSVTLQQIQAATQKAEKLNRLYKAAAEHWHNVGGTARLGSMRQIHRQLGRYPGEPDTEAGQYNDIQNKIDSIDNFYSDFTNQQSEVKSASGVATAWVARYADVDSLDSYDEAHGQPNPDSATAKSDSNQITSYGNDMPTESMTVYSIDASLATSAAGNYDATNPNSSAAIDSLDNKINAIYNSASTSDTDASQSAENASNNANSIEQIFSSEASNADSAGANDPHGTSYPVVNITTGNQFYDAMWNGADHRVNIMNNVNLWDLPGTYQAADNFQDIPGRNLTVNGLNDDGTWNTIDALDYNFEMDNVSNVDPGSNNTIKEDIENLRMYGNSYWGVFSINNDGKIDSTDSYQEFNNIDYVGTQLTYNQNSNTNSRFAGKIKVNLGAYEPGGDVNAVKYGYNSGGLSPVPYANEFDNPYSDSKAKSNFENHAGWNQFGNIMYPYENDGNDYDTTHPTVNAPSNQQIIQADGVNVDFEPGCRFEGYTSDGTGIATRYGANVNLGKDSYVHITPRGNWAENHDSDGNYLPDGIDLTGTSSLTIGNGATLKITPTDETDIYNNDTQNKNYYPGGIYVNGSGTMDIKPGGTVDISYPRYPYNADGMLSLPTNNDVGSGSPNGPFDIGGNATITAEDNAKLFVNGGNPSDASGSGDTAFLVAFNSTSTGHIQAMPGSTVDLSVGGSQPVILFNATGATQINVDDPKRFALNYKNNTSSGSQLASTGVGIVGNHVNVQDQNGKSYGQYSRTVFPGTFSNLVRGETDVNGINEQSNISNEVKNVYNQIDTWLVTNVHNSGVQDYAKNQFDKGESSTVQAIENILPYSVTTLTDQRSSHLAQAFNNSFDIPMTVSKQIQGTLNSAFKQYNISHYISDADVSSMLRNIDDNAGADGKDTQM